jgi:hypothetical protein
MSRTAALDAADPTESYAPGGILRNLTLRALSCQRPRQDATKCYARTPQYAPTPLHRVPCVGQPYRDGSRRTLKDAEPMTSHAKRAGVDGANLAKVLSGRRGPSRVVLAQLQATLAQDR